MYITIKYNIFDFLKKTLAIKKVQLYNENVITRVNKYSIYKIMYIEKREMEE